MTAYPKDYERTAHEQYRGHNIEVVFYRPDFGLQVDGSAIGSFFVNTAAALKAGRMHIDDLVDARNRA